MLNPIAGRVQRHAGTATRGSRHGRRRSTPSRAAPPGAPRPKRLPSETEGSRNFLVRYSATPARRTLRAPCTRRRPSADCARSTTPQQHAEAGMAEGAQLNREMGPASRWHSNTRKQAWPKALNPIAGRPAGGSPAKTAPLRNGREPQFSCPVQRNSSAAHPPCAVHAQEALRRLRTLNHATATRGSRHGRRRSTQSRDGSSVTLAQQHAEAGMAEGAQLNREMGPASRWHSNTRKQAWPKALNSIARWVQRHAGTATRGSRHGRRRSTQSRAAPRGAPPLRLHPEPSWRRQP